MNLPSRLWNELGLALGLANMVEEMWASLLPSYSGTSTLPGSSLLLLLLQRCMLLVVGRLTPPFSAMLTALGLTILELPVMLTELGLTILGLVTLRLREPLMDLTCEQTRGDGVKTQPEFTPQGNTSTHDLRTHVEDLRLLVGSRQALSYGCST